MSTRTSRRASQPPPTPTVSTPPRKERPPSPLSPSRVSRNDEKVQMRNLNDRLASYIDMIRSREAEIRGLQQVNTINVCNFFSCPTKDHNTKLYSPLFTGTNYY